MKYIVLTVKMKDISLELPFAFPNNMVHADFAEKMVGLAVDTFGTDCEVEVVSAGEARVMAVCSGFSDSLGVESRRKEDDSLFLRCDYEMNFI